MRGFAKYIIALGLGSVVFAALFFYLGYQRFHQPSETTNESVYILASGQGVIRTAYELEKQGLIDNADIFRIGVILSGYDRKLQAGEYKIPAAASMQDIMHVLASGKVIQHQLTIVEGWTSWQIKEYLKTIENLTGDLEKDIAEGSVLPDTYNYVLGTPRFALIKRMQNKQAAILDELWANREVGLPYQSKQDALIMASIIEKETAQESERAHIAGVFVNRLRKNMRLQTDPTVIYGISSTGSINRLLTRADIKQETPYNTYRIKGLPPTPIAHPGLASIKAALNPMQTKDLYFVANGEGGHNFAETLEGHLKNVRKWRKIRDK